MHILTQMELAADVANLERLMTKVSDCAREQQFSADKISDIEVSLEETLMNVFNHAYKDGPGNVKVTCCLDGDNSFLVSIEDSGIPFNALSLPDPDVTADVSEREIGGLGVFLIRKLMDDVQYRRENDRNILTLTVHKQTD